MKVVDLGLEGVDGYHEDREEEATGGVAEGVNEDLVAVEGETSSLDLVISATRSSASHHEG